MSKRQLAALEASEIRRAATSLIEAHGEPIARRVAARRADNAELSGSSDAARTWQQIARTVEMMARRAPYRHTAHPALYLTA